jgi:hypothetical protein
VYGLPPRTERLEAEWGKGASRRNGERGGDDGRGHVRKEMERPRPGPTGIRKEMERPRPGPTGTVATQGNGNSPITEIQRIKDTR